MQDSSKDSLETNGKLVKEMGLLDRTFLSTEKRGIDNGRDTGGTAEDDLLNVNISAYKLHVVLLSIHPGQN